MAALGSPISKDDYNNIRKIVYNVLGPGGTNPTTGNPDPTFGYGQTLLSSDISSGDQTITETQWDQLRLDINKAYTHQVGSATTIPDVAGTTNVGVTSATRVSYGQVYQTYLAAANDILTNRNLFAGSQRPGSPVTVTGGTKTTTTPWSVAVSQQIDVTFNSAAEARYFFNSGATINFRSSREGGTTSPQNAAAQNNSWTSFLNTVVGTVSFGKSQFYALTSGGLAENATPVFLFTAPAPYSNNYYRIKANCNVPSNTNGTATFISFVIEWIDSTTIPNIATDYIDGTLTSIVSETKSVGVSTINSPLSYNVGSLNPSGTAVNLAANFTLTSNVNTVSEGGTVIFTLTSRNYPSGKSYQLEITGISDSDLTGSTTGIKTLVTQGNDTLASVNYTVNIAADALTDPGESITARVTVASDGYQAGEVLTKSVTITDSSTTPTPSLTITSTTANVVAGEPDWGSYARVTATNTGTRVLNITSVSINHGAFLTDHQTNFPGNPTGNEVIWYQGSIATGQSGNFDIRFKGSTVGNQTATVTILSDGNDTPGGGPVPGTPKSFNVPVTVIAATFGITTSPPLAYTTSFASDGITPGNTAYQTIRVSNSTGNATVTLGSPAISITGEGNLTHNITNDPSGLTIAPGAYREFQIRFTGLTVPSSNSPSISIDCGTGGTKNITATVTGNASLPGITVSTPSLVATEQQINVETTSTFTITNSGSAALVVSSITITGQNSYSTYTASPSSFSNIPIGATQTVTVTSKRSRIGVDPATITITSNAPSPNNSKTVSFSMKSNKLGAYYVINTALFQGHPDASQPTPLKRNDLIESYVTGVEPNATAYLYHQQASGVITGVPAGTTPQAAFASKLNSTTSDGQGKLNFWTSGSSTAAWDIGISKLWVWIPVGKNDDGSQVWYDGPFKGGSDQGYVQMETFPNLTLTITPTSPVFPHTVPQSSANWPKVTWTVVGGIQNAPILFDSSSVRYDGIPQGPTQYSGTVPTLDAAGSATVSLPCLEPGVWTIVMQQTYKGTVYKTNAVTLTPTSEALYPETTPYPGLPEPQATMYVQKVTWAPWSINLPSNPNTYHKWYRTVSLSPNTTYTIRGWADDIGAVYSNYNFEAQTAQNTLTFDLTGPKTGTIQTNAQGKVRLIIVLFNGDNQQPTFEKNPSWISVQLLSGNSVVWNLSQATGAGY